MLHRSAVAALLAVSSTAGIALAGPTVEPLTTVRVASGLVRPIFATHAPGDFTRLYIIEKQGRIQVLNLKTGQLNPGPFLDIDSLVGGGTSNGSEQGLLGLAFHPDYPNTNEFYVNYTNNARDTVVARYETVTPDIANANSAAFIMVIDQPFSNHNGGWIGFGPDDGYLYISTGDGGSGGDPGNRGQTITNMLLGKMLRIDIDGGTPYAIPAGNPFVGITGDDEIWAYGLRNAWRPSFDRMTGDLYIADVGQGLWEEINFQAAASAGGENYGWRCYEGNHAFNLTNCPPASEMVFPIHEYPHGTGFSITGGYVYRGCEISTLAGTYFFADYVTERIWSFDYDGTVNNFTDRTAELRATGASINDITSFGEDARGEMYICDQTGEVFKIVPRTPTISPADFDCSGMVDVLDLLDLLAAWGPCDGCIEDINGDGVVDVLDLLDLLSMWG